MRMKKLGALAIALIAVMGGAYLYWQYGLSPALPQGIAGSNGRLEAERIDVASKYPGRVAEVLVTEGQWVQAGQILARMDASEVDAQLLEAEAAVVQAEQQKLQAQALLRQRQAELDFAKSEYDRTRKLADKGHVSQEQVDQARTVLATAEASVVAAEAGIDLADAAIKSAQATVARLQSIRSDADLTAPIDGRVQYILAHAGEVVAAGGRVVTLTDLTDLYMNIYLPAREAGLLALQSEARIILDPVPDYVVPATVTFVASKAQFTPKSVETAEERDQLMFRVKLSIPEQLANRYRDRAKAGVPGMGYVRLDETVDWPEWLQVKLPQ